MRQAAVKNNLSKGVLDPALSERMDLEQYYQGCRQATNAIALPQGGTTDRGGFRSLYRLRRKLRRITLAAAMVTATNGGTAANLVDQNAATELRTSVSVTGATFVVAVVDLGAVQTIAAVDAIQASCSTTGADAVLAVQTSTDNATWVQLGSAVNVRTTARTRRFAATPGTVVSARYLRLVVLGAPAIGTVGLMELRAWSETTVRSAVRRFQFTFDASQTYLLIATDRNIDIFRAGVFVAAVPIPHRADQLEIVTRAQSRDTILLFHPEVPTRTVFRQGADNEWDSYDQTFANVPAIAGDTSFGVAQDEVQLVLVSGLADGGQFQLLIEEAATASITKTGTASAIGTAIQAAVNALPNVGSGVVVSSVATTATTLMFRITFSGAAGSRSWPLTWVDVVTTDAAQITATTLQDGRPSSGAYMSKQTGWPRCGAFFQSRFVVGGFKLRPETILGSVLGDYFNFTQTFGGSLVAADVGIDFTLDSDEVSVIHHIAVGRHLQIFTENSEWYVSDRVIDATQPLNFIQATRYGVRPGVEPQQIEGAGVFVQGAGNVVREYLWADTEQTYTAESITLLASHLVADVVDVVYRRASATSEGTQIYMLNRDGSLAVMTRIRAQKVMATCPWTTDGLFRAIAVDAARRIYGIIERTIAGVTDLWLERLDETAALDASIAGVLAPAAATIAGLGELEGKSVWAVADGVPFGPFTVTGATITLPRAVTAYEVGLFYDFVLETMPWKPVDKDGTALLGPRRITAVTAVLDDTTSLAVAANGGPSRAVGLRPLPALLDARPVTNGMSGPIRIDRLYGRIDGPTVTITRPLPGRITVKALYLEAQ